MFKRKEERRRFTREEKEQMLSKSNGKCAHCGKGLTVSTMTAEHVIPISQGGSNNISNMVALDKDCNAEKDDSIIDPLAYYKYVDEEILSELCQQSSIFYQEQMWLDNKKFLPEDKKVYPWYLPASSGRKHKSKIVMNANTPAAKLILTKAEYRDLEDVYIYTIKKYKELSLVWTLEEIKYWITLWFSNGAIYTIRNGAKEILGVIVFYLTKVKQSKTLVPTIWELLFNKRIEGFMRGGVIADFFSAFCNVNKCDGIDCSWVGFCVPTGRQDLLDFVNSLGLYIKVDNNEGSVYYAVVTVDKEKAGQEFDLNELLYNNTYKRID